MTLISYLPTREKHSRTLQRAYLPGHAASSRNRQLPDTRATAIFAELTERVKQGASATPEMAIHTDPISPASEHRLRQHAAPHDAETPMLSVFLKTSSIFIIILFGVILRKMRIIDAPFNQRLSHVLMKVFYPALIYSVIVRTFTLGSIIQKWTLPAGAALIMGIGWLVGALIAPRLKQQPDAARRMFHFQCTMNNYSFLPIMLATMLWGEEGVAMVVFSTLGAEVMVWTAGIQSVTGRKISPKTLKHLVSMPISAMLAAFVTLAIRAAFDSHCIDIPAHHPRVAETLSMFVDTLHRTGQATIPVSAVIAGSRMAELRPHHIATPLMAGTALLRLIAIPAIAVGVLACLPVSPDVRAILLVIAVMPCALSSIPIAEVYQGDGEFAAASVLVTHILCLLTIPLWLQLLGISAQQL